jgi:hypothetical protein
MRGASARGAGVAHAATARRFSEKSKRIAYWSATGVIALIMVESGFVYLRHAPGIFDELGDLPFPGAYMLLGLIEVFGSAVLLAPGWPRLKLWAYAAFALVFGSDVFSAIAFSERRYALASVIALLLLAISFRLRPAVRRR